MPDIKTPVLNLHSLNVNEETTAEATVHFKGVAPGALSSLLRAMGIAGSTDLRINASYLELKSGSVNGEGRWFVPTGSLSSIQGGYRKEFALLPMSLFIFILGVIGDVFISFDENRVFVLFTYITLFFAIVLLLIYYFTKTMFIEIESGGGMSARIQFKGALSGAELEHALDVMQGVIAKAQSGEELILMAYPTISNEVIQSPAATVQQPVAQVNTQSAPAPAATVQQPVAQVNTQSEPAATVQQPVAQVNTQLEPAATVQQPVAQVNTQPNMMNISPRMRLYTQCVKNGIEIGTFEQFDEAMNHPERRLKFYQQAFSNNINLGTFEDFELKIGTQQ